MIVVHGLHCYAYSGVTYFVIQGYITSRCYTGSTNAIKDQAREKWEANNRMHVKK